MNYGVFRSFVESDEEKEVINILENLESRQEVKDIKIKSANKKTVIYIVTSDTRFETQTLLNEQLSNAGFSVNKVFVGAISNSQESTEFLLPSGAKRRIGFKPSRGMQDTTFMASITELFPAIAFLNNISPTLPMEQFYNAILAANPSKDGPPGPYLSTNDATKGKEIIDKSEPGPDFKIREKITNAKNITRWLNTHNQKHPIAEVYWGYRTNQMEWMQLIQAIFFSYIRMVEC